MPIACVKIRQCSGRAGGDQEPAFDLPDCRELGRRPKSVLAQSTALEMVAGIVTRNIAFRRSCARDYAMHSKAISPVPKQPRLTIPKPASSTIQRVKTTRGRPEIA